MKALGLDIGTTTISAVVVGMEEREILKAYTIPNGSFIETDLPWEKIQDPDKIMQKALGLLEEILQEHQDIGVIGLTGQMHGIVYLDENGKHISPLYTWQDGRGNIPVEKILSEDPVPEDALSEAGRSICGILEEEYGVKAHTGYGLVTHLYNCRNNLVPEGAAKVCTIMDYLGMRLTGRRTPLMHSSNAASLGLYDAKKNGFRADILQKAGADADILPEVTDDFISVGSYKGIPVSAAIGDNQASFLGSVENAADSVLVNMGTGGQISVLSDTYFTAKGIEARPFVKGHYLLAGSSLCGGRAYALLEHFFRSYAEAAGITGVDHYSVMGKILDEKNDGEKLKVNTTFSGTREKPEKRGSIKNIGTENFTPKALIGGVLEGMAEELYKMYRKIEKGLAGPKTRMVASGNGIRKNRHLQEVMSEKFGMSLELAKREEEAAYGAAVSGMIAAGELTLKEAIGV
jgi:Sugar (pentulose and hexulose) kinases